MYFVLVLLLSSTSAFKFGGPKFTIAKEGGVQGARPLGEQGNLAYPQDNFQEHTIVRDQDLTVTVSETRDIFETRTNKFYNSVPILVTDFKKTTVTLPTREVVRTPVDDMVIVRTQAISQFPATETVTDVFSMHRLHTEVSTDAFTVTHLDQNVLQTTITSLVVKTFTFRPTIVRTVIDTELVRTTETEYYTSTIFEGLQTRRVYY